MVMMGFPIAGESGNLEFWQKIVKFAPCNL